MDIISIPLGWLMWLCYKVIPIYGVALLLFTLLTRALLVPSVYQAAKVYGENGGAEASDR